MRSRRLHRGALVGAFFFAAPVALAAIQVVDDSACERYAVDIASFATCEDGKVVKAVDDPPGHAARGAGAAAPAKEPEPRADAASTTTGVAARRAEVARAQPR